MGFLLHAIEYDNNIVTIMIRCVWNHEHYIIINIYSHWKNNILKSSTDTQQMKENMSDRHQQDVRYAIKWI